ncbi:hypothetical protein [Neochlamydia sp. AcF95]|uniref:hypothetical protein n=1 Tax=Neochlamydia sp. AcF95 TaxID=2795734 RepID=UPI001BC9EADD|nr:hypothetical protein [Neochlamydia sp. AcF95]
MLTTHFKAAQEGALASSYISFEDLQDADKTPLQYQRIFLRKMEELAAIIERFNNLDLDVVEAWDAIRGQIIRLNLSVKNENKIYELFKEKLSLHAELELRKERLEVHFSDLEWKFRFKPHSAENSFKIAFKRLKFFTHYYSSPKEQEHPFNTEWLYQRITTIHCSHEHQKELLRLIFNIWSNREGDPPLIYQLRIQMAALESYVNTLSSLSIEEQKSEETHTYKTLYDKIILTCQQLILKYKQKSLRDEEWDLFCSEICKVPLKYSDEKELWEFISEQLKMSVAEIRYQRYLWQYNAYSNGKCFRKEKFETLLFTLEDLSSCYAQGTLEKAKWDLLCEKIVQESLLPLGQKQELIEVFLRTWKTPSDSWLSTFWHIPNFLASYWKEEKDEGKVIWRDEKIFTLLKSMHEWVVNNEAFIHDKLSNRPNHSPLIQEKVEELIKLLTDLRLPLSNDIGSKICKSPVYNQMRKESHIACLSKLREILKDAKDDFELYKSLGEESASGYALVLKQLCDHMFTEINGVALMRKALKEIMPIGLEELIKKETRFIVYRQSNLLLLPIEVQHAAIVALPPHYKLPLLDLLGWKTLKYKDHHQQCKIPYKILNLKVSQKDGSEKIVNFHRFARPTSKTGLNPEFDTFSAGSHRLLLINLQSKTFNKHESERAKTDALISLNREKWLSTFVAIFPLNHSALFYPKEEYMDPAPHIPRYKTTQAFMAALMEKIISPGIAEESSNRADYVFPKAWKISLEFKELATKCMYEVKEIFFKDVDPLMQSHRRIFVKLFNARLILALLPFMKADAFACFSSDATDRTDIVVSLLLKMVLIMCDLEDKPIYQEEKESPLWKEVLAIFEASTLVTAPRQLHKNILGLMQAFEIFDKPGVRERLRHAKELIGVKGAEFPFIYNKEEWQIETLPHEKRED